MIIQPSFGNKSAQQHWKDTLDRRVPFTQPRYADALRPAERAALNEFHPDGSARFWGAQQVHDLKMAGLDTGTVVLFTGQKLVRAVGEVAAHFHNPEFADVLWPPVGDQTSWSNVYSLLNFQPAKIPYEEIWDLPSFNPGDNFMGLRFLDEVKSAEVLEGLGIETAMAAYEQEAKDRAILRALESGTTIIPVEAVLTEQTTYSAAGGKKLVRRIESLLKKEYIATLQGVTVSSSKTEAGLTDLYLVGPAGVEIVEAKRSGGREFVRAALAQLLHYAPDNTPPIDRLSALFPEKPKPGDIDFLHRYGVDCIFRVGAGKFERLVAPPAARTYMKQRWTAP